MNKNLLLAKRFSFLFFICNLLFNTSNFAQLFNGSVTDINAVRGSGVTVDDALTIIYAGTIVNANVFVNTNYQTGDILSINNAIIPGGGSSSFNSASARLTITGTGTAAQWQAALRTVQFTAGSSASGTKEVSFNLGDAVLNSANGHYYEFVTPGMTWTNGKTAASGRTLFGIAGYLATITDNSENLFISTKLQTDGWIGSSDDYLQINTATGTTTYADQAAAEGNWYWVSGPEKGRLFSRGNNNPTTVTFARWNSSEPNNSGGNENYGEIYATRSAWNDLPNTSILPIIVEYGGTPGDPVIDISHSRNVIVLVPTLTGNAITQAYFTSDNNPYIVDPTVHFSNTGDITDVTINISGGFTPQDFLDINALLVPAGITSQYDPLSGTWFFGGTATPEEWRLLMASVTFRTTNPDPINRTVTFNMGNKPASAEGHFYALSPVSESFDFNTMYYYLQWYHPELATFNGMTGYMVNIQSAEENSFLHKKMQTDFWLPLTDDYNFLMQLSGEYYEDQSATESNFYWIAGLTAGTLVSTGNAGSVVPEAGVYNNWDAEEPSNIGDPNNGNSTYFNNQSINGTWFNDDLNGNPRPYVIEYGGYPGDPPTYTVFTKTMSMTGVLPITLTKFAARAVGKTVVAEWETSAEKNNSYFNLERSATNNNFTTIGRVEGGGTATSIRKYNYTDIQPLTGTNYYRLKQVDIDNHFVYSPISKVDFNLQDKNSSIYPTLVTSSLTVQIVNPGNARCIIINAAGNVVQRITPSGSIFTVNVNTLPKGSYVFRIVTADNGGKEENLRFVKQ